REAGDSLEQEGIRRSHETVAKAELIVHVFDVSQPFTREDELYLARFAHKKRIIVRNKIDLPTNLVLPADLPAGCAAAPFCPATTASEIAEARRMAPPAHELERRAP